MKRVFAHIGFSTATALIVLNMISAVYVPYIATGLALMLCVSLALKKYRQAVTVPLCLSSALFACLLFLCVYYSAVEPALSLSGKTAELTFCIKDLPQFDGGKYIYTAKATRILLNGAPQSVNLRVVSDKPVCADAFQLVNAKARFYSTGSNAFNNFGKWGDGIYLNAKLIEFSVTDNDVFSPMKYILLLRNDIIELLVRNLKNNTGALSAALVTGDRYYLSNDVITAFRLAGVSHLTAISGLHLGVISGSFYYVAKRTGVPVKPRNALIIILVILYMALAGFSGSVTRAGIMFITVFSADFFKRKPDTLNSLGFAVFIICLNPFAVGDSGAVLSVLSVLSLITLYPYLKNQFSKVFDYRNDRRNRKTYPFRYIIAYVLKSVLLSVSVLLYTLPAVFLFFGYFNATSLVSNILLIPLGSIATVLSLLCYISLKLKFLCTAFVITVSGVDSLIIILVKFFAGFELMRFSLTGWFSFVIAAVLAVFAVNFIVFKNKTLKTAFVITFIILAFSLAINAFTQYNINI